jgi:DNA-binding CsgD family transcriptional regulator
VPADRLTIAEEKIFNLLADGRSNEEMAAELGISRRTVESHLYNVYRKYGVHSREELIAQFEQDGGVIGARASETEVRTLRKKVAEQDRQLASYTSTMDKFIDRQFPLFEEAVELTVSIGSRPGEDMVTERHWTSPTPYLVYRVIRPIAAFGPVYDPDAAAISCDVVGADVGIAVDALSDRNGRPVATILFQPGLETRTEWILRYRTPGIWNPLRATGRDTLRWSPGRLDGRSAASIHDLTVHFDFPAATAEPSVAERNEVGEVTYSDSGLRITYRDHSRAGALYEFILGMALGDDQPG